VHAVKTIAAVAVIFIVELQVEIQTAVFIFSDSASFLKIATEASQEASDRDNWWFFGILKPLCGCLMTRSLIRVLYLVIRKLLSNFWTLVPVHVLIMKQKK
jgi:hypothetical protein